MHDNGNNGHDIQHGHHRELMPPEEPQHDWDTEKQGAVENKAPSGYQLPGIGGIVGWIFKEQEHFSPDERPCKQEQKQVIDGIKGYIEFLFCTLRQIDHGQNGAKDDEESIAVDCEFPAEELKLKKYGMHKGEFRERWKIYLGQYGNSAPNCVLYAMISRGVGFMLLATFFFALMNVFVKLLPGIPAVEIVFFRSLISLIISVVILKAQGISVWGKSRGWLLLRGFVGAIALVLYFITIQLIPLATAVTIQFITPIFTTIIGIFMNRERVAPIQWVFFLIAFSGIMIIQGFDERVTLDVVLIGIFAAVFAGIAYNVIRKLKTSEHPLVIIFYFPLVTMPLTGTYSAFEWVGPSGIDWIYLLLVGVLNQIAQYYMTRAYQEEELNKVASVSYAGIFYALFFGWVIFDESFNLQTYAGMVVVLLGVVLNLWYKQYRMRKIL